MRFAHCYVGVAGSVVLLAGSVVLFAGPAIAGRPAPLANAVGDARLTAPGVDITVNIPTGLRTRPDTLAARREQLTHERVEPGLMSRYRRTASNRRGARRTGTAR